MLSNNARVLQNKESFANTCIKYKEELTKAGNSKHDMKNTVVKNLVVRLTAMIEFVKK